jgi:hypothetical protein
MYMLLLATAVTALVPALKADVPDLQTYTINFTATFGTAPTAGSFTYDPDTATFSDFLVTWDGSHFDLTSSANNPNHYPTLPSCIGGKTGGAASFALLTGACDPPPSNYLTLWGAGNGPPTFLFKTENFDSTVGIGVSEQLATPNPPPPFDDSQGTWTVTRQTTSPVPEPSSLILLAPVCALLARRRIGKALRLFGN